MTDKVPFNELKSDVNIAMQIVQEIDRGLPDDTCTELNHVITLCELMMDCWKFEPKNRPDIKSCCNRVKWMVSVLSFYW